MKGDFSRSTYRPANHYSSVRLQQGRVLLDAEWNEQADLGLHRERGATTDVVGATGAPKHAPGEFRHFAVALAPGATDLVVAPGHIYVNGILCENDDEGGTPLTAQRDVPGFAVPDVDGAYAVYLDVWERHVTPVDQGPADFPGLREVALGGPDTATRTRVVWQTRLAPIESKACGRFAPPDAPTGRLRARAVPSAQAEHDCLVPTGGGYRRLENQLYRVEIHDEAQGNTRFKWSRDNASVVSKIKAIDEVALTITVEDPGRDDVLGFAGARFVELTDERRVLQHEPGVLLEVQTVAGDAVTVLDPGGASLAVGSHPTLRRWDGTGAVVANTPVELEDGVQIEFDGGTFSRGDYWLVAARTLTGRVDWPSDNADPPEAIFEPRHGIEHHYCVLAVVDLAGGVFSGLVDCRPLFPPLTGIAASDVSYDPAACGNLTKASTVQQAIDILCRLTGGREEGIRIEKVTLLDGRELDNDAVIAAAELARGLRISCDRPVFQDSVRNERGLPNPVCKVTLDLPWPTTAVERDQWRVPSSGFMGFTTVTLAGQVNADDNDIFWTPLGQAPSDVGRWLAESVLGVTESHTHGLLRRLLGRLVLEGNFIWGSREPELYLDGEVFGVPAAGRTALRLPSGNDRRGGVFAMWFWVGEAEPPRPVPERVGIIPGRLSRFFGARFARAAVNFGIQRDARPLVQSLPAGYDVDASQQFDPQTAAELARQTGLRGLTGFVSSRFERLGAVLNAMITTNLLLDVRTEVLEDNVLLRQVRVMMAAGNPPDFVIGDETLMAKLGELEDPSLPMIAI